MTQQAIKQETPFPPLHALYMQQLAAKEDASVSHKLSEMRKHVMDELEAMMGLQRSHMVTVRSLNTTDKLLNALQA